MSSDVAVRNEPPDYRQSGNTIVYNGGMQEKFTKAKGIRPATTGIMALRYFPWSLCAGFRKYIAYGGMRHHTIATRGFSRALRTA